MNIHKKDIQQLLRFCLALVIYSFGTYFLVKSDLGLAPWEMFAMGLSYHCPLSFGQVIIAIGLIVILFDIAMKEKIGLGMILDTLLVGNITDFFIARDCLPDLSGYFQRGLVYFAGLFIMSFGVYLCMSSAQGIGPRDAMLVAVGKKVKAIPIGAIQFGILAIVFAAGYLLGGPVGIGTVLSVTCIGALLQFWCRIFHFEPRDVVHKSIREYFIV